MLGQKAWADPEVDTPACCGGSLSTTHLAALTAQMHALFSVYMPTTYHRCKSVYVFRAEDTQGNYLGTILRKKGDCSYDPSLC